jgi:hypothetical protein
MVALSRPEIAALHANGLPACMGSDHYYFIEIGSLVNEEEYRKGMTK